MEYDMEQNFSQYEQGVYRDGNEKPEKSGMATASMIMGILSLVLCCSCFGGLVFGSLAVIFSLLSKTEMKMNGQAKAGLILGIIGLVLTVAAWGGLWIYLMIDSYQELKVMPLPEPNNLLTIFMKTWK